MTMACTCGELMLDGKGTGCFNLNYDCPEHGTESEWYRSDEQVAKRKVDTDRLRDLQLRAAAARKAARNG
jgi:hypothetical protein